MIYDTFDHARQYLGYSKNLDRALRLIAENTLSQLPLGSKVLVLGEEDIFVNVSEYEAKKKEAMKLEAHRSYIDIQCILAGNEKVALCPLEETTGIISENESGDIWKYEGPCEWHDLCQGHFLVLFPHEAHGPSVEYGSGDNHVKKALIKVRV